MTKEYSRTLTEVSEILKNMAEEEVNMIPVKLREFIEENKNREYQFVIKPYIPLEEQVLQRQTIAFLGLLNLYYWCSEDEKEELKSVFKQNDDKIKSEQLVGFEDGKVFIKDYTDFEPKPENMPTIYGIEKWFSKFVNSVKKFLGLV